jgi:hypothetical protein
MWSFLAHATHQFSDDTQYYGNALNNEKFHESVDARLYT